MTNRNYTYKFCTSIIGWEPIGNTDQLRPITCKTYTEELEVALEHLAEHVGVNNPLARDALGLLRRNHATHHNPSEFTD